MKFVLLATLALTSLASFASVEYSNIGSCEAVTREVPGRAVNFGLQATQETIYCISYKQVKTTRHILRDAESRGMPVPGSRPWYTVSKSEERDCYRDGIVSSALAKCEHARANLLNN